MSKFLNRKSTFWNVNNNSMDNSNNVQLHEIIKNSLATYLSYKWSADKLYLKKRTKKCQKEEKHKDKEPSRLTRERSIINLENNVFIYDANNKTFTQLDLCDCFKNGLKYRKIDPFATKSNKKKYELCEMPRNAPDDREYQSFQLINVKDSVEHIFSNGLMKKKDWADTMNNLCPSNFDIFIHKEFNNCAGKNFDVKSIKINTKQETSTSSNDKVCSSAAIGYYKITTYDDALQFEDRNNQKVSTGKKMNTKQCNFVGIHEESVIPKKLYSKSLQCTMSNHIEQKKEKFSTSKDLGVQCFFVPMQNTVDKSIKHRIGEKNNDRRYQNKKSPVLRQKYGGPKKTLRRTHSSLSDLFLPTECKHVGNLIQTNSSAELRRILNDDYSDSTVNLSNTGEYFRTFMSPRPLMTYYQNSSSSKDNRGDTNDEMYTKNEPIIRVVAETKEVHSANTDAIVTVESKMVSPICSIHCKKNFIPKIPSCKCTYETTKHKVPPPVQKPVSVPKLATACSSKCIGPCSIMRKPSSIHSCPSTCPCVGQKDAEKRDPLMPCICPTPPRKACCECNRQVLSTTCICDLLCNLRERIKKQTEEQNRNLDQILEELDKQDKEIQLIRQYVGKSQKVKKNKRCKKGVCSCYAATVQYDFNTIPAVAQLKTKDNIDQIYRQDVIAFNSAEPEIIEIFGSEKKFESKKHIYSVFEKDSWRAMWKKNSKILFVNDFFKKRNILREKFSSSTNSSNSPLKNYKNDKKDCKQWFSKLAWSRKELR